jgi:hypothetical protein
MGVVLLVSLRLVRCPRTFCHDTSEQVAMVSAATGAPVVDVCTTCIVYLHFTNCSISLSASSAALQSVITTE